MPRKTLKQRKERELQRRPTSDSSNRVRNIVNDLIGTEDPEDLMMKIVLRFMELGPLQFLNRQLNLTILFIRITTLSRVFCKVTFYSIFLYPCCE